MLKNKKNCGLLVFGGLSWSSSLAKVVFSCSQVPGTSLKSVIQANLARLGDHLSTANQFRLVSAEEFTATGLKTCQSDN